MTMNASGAGTADITIPGIEERTARLRLRLLSRLVIDPSGCLLWSGYKGSGGYGRIAARGFPGRHRNPLVHRLMFKMFEGPIPDGLTLDHLCRVRHCANVSHLEPVTNRVNILRGAAPSAVAAAKTHCPRGHPYAGENLYVTPSGRRNCRQCNRDNCRRRYYARKAAMK